MANVTIKKNLTLNQFDVYVFACIALQAPGANLLTIEECLNRKGIEYSGEEIKNSLKRLESQGRINHNSSGTGTYTTKD